LTLSKTGDVCQIILIYGKAGRAWVRPGNKFSFKKNVTVQCESNYGPQIAGCLQVSIFT